MKKRNEGERGAGEAAPPCLFKGGYCLLLQLTADCRRHLIKMSKVHHPEVRKEKGAKGMEITLIHGQMHKGSSWHASTLLVDSVKEKDTVIHEFYLPEDGPDHCIGCFACILRGEEKCPDGKRVGAIISAMRSSQIIIIDSPTYCLEMSGQLKTLFDHLGFMWMSHRPDRTMFTKTGVVVSTCAGTGAKNTVKSMARQLRWLGVPKVYRLPLRVNASSYQEIPDPLKAVMAEKAAALAGKITQRAGKEVPRIPKRIFFSILAKNQKRNSWNPLDKAYWESQGWLHGKRPWREIQTEPGENR